MGVKSIIERSENVRCWNKVSGALGERSLCLGVVGEYGRLNACWNARHFLNKQGCPWEFVEQHPSAAAQMFSGVEGKLPCTFMV